VLLFQLVISIPDGPFPGPFSNKPNYGMISGIASATAYEHVLIKLVAVNSKGACRQTEHHGRRLAVEHNLGMLAAGDTARRENAAFRWKSSNPGKL
jgi:hypothetical protein